MTELLRLSALGGLLGLDTTGVGQFMVSRPLVAGLLTGWLLGDPSLGLMVGVVLELYLLVSFPSGGARFPEGSTATVVAVSCAVPFDVADAVPLAVAVGLVWGQISGSTVTYLRHVNSMLVPEQGDREPSARWVTGAHVAAITLDFLRASLVTVSGIFVGRLVVGAVIAAWPLPEASSTGLLLVGGAVSVGILVHDLGGIRRRGGWLFAGIALGLVGAQLL